MSIATTELETVAFYRGHYLKSPEESDLPTMADIDVHKLPALNKLVEQIFLFRDELTGIGLNPVPDKPDGATKNLYLLQDREWVRPGTPTCMFHIRIKCNWLDKDYTMSLGGFEFRLKVCHDGYNGSHEIADWITVEIKNMPVTPISLGSWREHVRCLNGSYLSDMHMPPVAHGVNFDRLDKGMNLTTSAFNLAVNDACTVMQYLIARKEFLFAVDDSK